MAFADTQKLIVDLSLSGNFRSGITGAQRDLSGFSAAAARASGGATKLGQGLASGFSLASAAVQKFAVIGIGALASQVAFGIGNLRKLDEVTAQTVAGLKSTAGASGQTVESIRKLAEAYEDLNSTIDDKVIQSTENLLLTFPKINREAFEPALAAILDLNTALGGGEAGLQGVAIQVGKALQDPVRGLLALRRVGVSFTPEQEKQIKLLVSQNRLYDAQKIILGELSTEFGGRFAAQGKTATGTFSALGDAVEDLQSALAEGLLPVLTDVARDLAKAFRDPATVSSVREFGTNIAGAFKTAVEWVKKLDLAAIGAGLKTAAGLAKDLIGAFLSAPAWVQQLAVGGFIANKVTGGGVVDIGGALVGALAHAGLGKAFVQPVFVTNQALPGVGGAGGGGFLGAVKNLALFAGAIGIATIAIDKWQNELVPLNEHIADQTNTIRDAVNAYSLQKKSQADLLEAYKASIEGLGDLESATSNLGPLAEVFYGDQFNALRESRDAIIAEVARRKSLATDERAQAVAEAQQHNDLSLAFDRLEGAASPMSKAFIDVAAAARQSTATWRAAMKEELAILHGRFRIPTIAGAKDTSGNLLKLADVLVGKFERSRAPFYNDVKNERRAIEGLERLQRHFIATGDRKSAAAIGRDIARMKADLHGTTSRTAEAIRRKRLSVSVTNSVNVRTYVSSTSVVKSYNTVSKYGTVAI